MGKKSRNSSLVPLSAEFATFHEPRVLHREDKKVAIDLAVTLGENVKSTNRIYVVGNVNELGNWNVVKAKPLRQSDGKFIYRFEVEPNTKVEFKVCKGKSWDEVEKGMFNEEICNHSFLATQNQDYKLEVFNWNS